MELSVSNIAWPAELDQRAYALLAERGVRAIEVAPTRVWPNWAGIDDAAIAAFTAHASAHGLRCSSLQSILFAKPELQLFGEGSAMEQHLVYCAELAGRLGAGPLVFGAPKNRLRGELPFDDAFARAVDIFRRVAPAYQANGVVLCMEANPADYGCDFVTRASEAAELVRAVDHPGFRLHLDTACALLAGEDIGPLIESNADILAHFHISEPMLGSFAAPEAHHARAAEVLSAIGYRRTLAIEMRTQQDTLPAIGTAIEFAQATYGKAGA